MISAALWPIYTTSRSDSTVESP